MIKIEDKKIKIGGPEAVTQEQPPSAKAVSIDIPPKLAGYTDWLQYAMKQYQSTSKSTPAWFTIAPNVSKVGNPSAPRTGRAEMAQKAARSLTYYINQAITTEKMDATVKAIGEISADIQRGPKKEMSTGQHFQKQVLNIQLSPRAQQVFDDAKSQTPGVHLASMSTTERRAYLAVVFKKNSLGEVENMWKVLLPVINFKAMYNITDSTSAEDADLMKKWRIYNRECWLRGMENEIELRCKLELSNKDSAKRYGRWRTMILESKFVPFLPPDISKVPVVWGDSCEENVPDDLTEEGYQVKLQAGPGVDLEEI